MVGVALTPKTFPGMGLAYYRTKFGISAAMSPIVELLKKVAARKLGPQI